MMKRKLIATALLLVVNSVAVYTVIAQVNKVTIVGQMRDVMWKGQLEGKIDLDTIGNKTHLFGFGPVEYLAGEILVIDGRSYKSNVVSENDMNVVETFQIKAPFFAYANIEKWHEEILPDSIRNIEQLERYLVQLLSLKERPFLFRLSGTVEHARIHIVNLPKAAKVSSPQDAHQGQANYDLKNEDIEIIGFFSTSHKSIFTHHDSFLHMHLITKDRKKMGHLDEAIFKKESIRIYLPAE